jgi:membrane-bound lytic murein transglycosylase A
MLLSYPRGPGGASAAQSPDTLLSPKPSRTCRSRVRLALALALSSVLLSGCFLLERPLLTQRYEPARWSQLPGWSSDAMQEAWPAFLASCEALRAHPEWAPPCTAALAVARDSGAAIHAYFEQYFEPYRILDVPSRKRVDTGRITGYYEPLLMGSRTRSAQFSVPLYSPPPDLLTVDLAAIYPQLKGMPLRGRLDGHRVIPYYSRADLASDPVLQGHEIVWVQDALDAFLLEVQGSGRVQLPDGQVIRLQYADQNGQPYHAIGRYLVQQGELTVEEASVPGIRAWLDRNPQRLAEVLGSNPSVVFFKEVAVSDPRVGPKGSEGVPLTAGRSIAVDPRFVPLGAPVFLATTWPDSGQPLQRLVIAQDTGGAISGAPRADLFLGVGSQAGGLAGEMRQTGSLWLLWPRNMPLPTS